MKERVYEAGEKLYRMYGCGGCIEVQIYIVLRTTKYGAWIYKDWIRDYDTDSQEQYKKWIGNTTHIPYAVKTKVEALKDFAWRRAKYLYLLKGNVKKSEKMLAEARLELAKHDIEVPDYFASSYEPYIDY